MKRKNGNLVTTGEDGKFELPNEDNIDAIIAVHKEGYAQVTPESLKSSPQIKLQSWGTIEGILKIGNRSGTNEMVYLNSADPSLAGFYDFQEFRAKTDDQGRFIISQVPPGEQQIARLIPLSEDSWRHGVGMPVTVKAGGVTSVTVGGSGRTVKGKAMLDESERKVNWSNGFFSIHNSYPKPAPEVLKSAEQRKAWMKSDEYKESNEELQGLSIANGFGRFISGRRGNARKLHFINTTDHFRCRQKG